MILSNTDGSQTWSDPAAGTAWPDVLVFQRDTTGARYYGAELRLPTTGESIHQDNDIWTVDAVLTDGQDQLATFTYWDSYSPAIVSTRFFDLQTRSTIKIGDSDRISGGGVRASLSDGRLFINAMGSDNSDFGGFGVWNLRTQQWDVLRNREEADKLKISSLAYYGGHLYVTNDADTYTVLNLPSTDPVATNWSVRPYARMSGWTLVCRGENTNSSHDCETVALVRDEDGHYPGPWT